MYELARIVIKDAHPTREYMAMAYVPSSLRHENGVVDVRVIGIVVNHEAVPTTVMI